MRAIILLDGMFPSFPVNFRLRFVSARGNLLIEVKVNTENIYLFIPLGEIAAIQFHCYVRNIVVAATQNYIVITCTHSFFVAARASYGIRRAALLNGVTAINTISFGIPIE